MKDVIVVSYLTHRQHMIDEYEDQLATAGIDFHLEWVTLADGIGSVTARWKMQFLFDMCHKFGEYQRIVFTDAWDVLFFGTKEALLPKVPAETMVSAERNCWPETDLASRIQSDSPWPYVNAGMIAGSPSLVSGWASSAMATPDLDLMEQAWFNRRLVEQDFPIYLDWGTSLFYTVSADKEDGSLRLADGKLWNSHYDSHPQFIHFAGPCSSVPFRAMLRTGKPLNSGEKQ